jgi:hypothetical protein
MHFSDLLRLQSVDPGGVLMLRHAPPSVMNKIFAGWALERPDMFNAYQQTQGERAESAMKKANYVASFMSTPSGETLFVGLYRVNGFKAISQDKLWSLPAYKEMSAFGLRETSAVAKRETVLLFDLEATNFYADWKGKLVIEWTPPERSWFRWADRNHFAIKSILAENALNKAMPAWNEIVLSYQELKNLPAAWRAELARWRGVYLIVDTFDRKPYVGSARGVDNILGRWLNYADSADGGNKLLRGRDPTNFRYSVLELTSPNIDGAELLAVENRWKARLHSRHPFGLNLN